MIPKRNVEATRLKIILVATLCVVLIANTVRAQDYSKALDSAAFVHAAISGVVAVLTQCAVYDMQNLDSYTKLQTQYMDENKVLRNRLMTIMRAETVRNGYSLETLQKMLLDMGAKGLEMAEKQHRENPGLFLSNCRVQWEVHDRGLAAYKPIRELYPIQMRTIDEWK